MSKTIVAVVAVLTFGSTPSCIGRGQGSGCSGRGGHIVDLTDVRTRACRGADKAAHGHQPSLMPATSLAGSSAAATAPSARRPPRAARPRRRARPLARQEGRRERRCFVFIPAKSAPSSDEVETLKARGLHTATPNSSARPSAAKRARIKLPPPPRTTQTPVPQSSALQNALSLRSASVCLSPPPLGRRHPIPCGGARLLAAAAAAAPAGAPPAARAAAQSALRRCIGGGEAFDGGRQRQ